ncbi:MAG: hypothetical protein ACOYNN_17330 [Terrimicrobiaceae bacterium]|jgi:hypothetical protein
MSRLLDYRLRLVAKLRQVSIKTARDWRDGGNKKWDKAIKELRKAGHNIPDTTKSFFDQDYEDTLEAPDIPEIPDLPDPFKGLESFTLESLSKTLPSPKDGLENA